MFLSQRKYVVEITCNPSRTLVDTDSKLRDDVLQVCLHMHDFREPYFSTLKRIIRYVRGTLDHGLRLFSSSITSLVAYSDADRAVALLLGGPLLVIVYFLATTYSLGPLSVNRRFLVQVQRHSIVVLPMLLLRLVGCGIFHHQRIKHIEMDIHFVRDLVAAGHVRVLHVPSCYQYAYIFTKGLPSDSFEEFCTSLNARCPPAPTAGEC
ncbi:ribonuclease H-like domain-containing protein [Tanacetum coccineum]